MGRDGADDPRSSKEKVSIHAPTWGATMTVFRCKDITKSFNPRAHVGRDIVFGKILSNYLSFNPRAHVGRDPKGRVCNGAPFVSIHAPTWGATKPPEGTGAADTVSIHAPTWGATIKWFNSSVMHGSFNPRAHVGRDSTKCKSRFNTKCFNPRAHVGRDCCLSL